MGRISVITCDASRKKHPSAEVGIERICENEIVNISLVRGSKRFLRRALARHNIDRAVLDGDMPEYVTDELEKSFIRVYDGQKLARMLLPEFISRAAKQDRRNQTCTIYDDTLDEESMDIINLASLKFRYVSLCTQCARAYEVAHIIQGLTGLSLKIGESKGGVAIVRTGKGGDQDIKISLSDLHKTVFVDEKKRKIPAPLAEAIAGNEFGEDILDKLHLKIYKYY